MPNVVVTLHPSVIESLTNNPHNMPRSAYIRQVLIERLIADGVNLPPAATAPVIPGAHNGNGGKQ